MMNIVKKSNRGIAYLSELTPYSCMLLDYYYSKKTGDIIDDEDAAVTLNTSLKVIQKSAMELVDKKYLYVAASGKGINNYFIGKAKSNG